MANDREAAETGGKTGRSAGEQDDSGLTRRKWVTAGAATWASASLAGCNYLTGPGDDGGTPTPEETTTGEMTTTQGTGDGTNTTVTTQTTTTDSNGGNGGATTTEDCGSVSTFSPGMEIGIIVGVFESTTGSFLGSQAIESVEVDFPTGAFDTLELEWEGPHESFSTDGWGQTLQIAEDATPGTYQYEVTIVPKDGVGIDASTVIDQFSIQ